MTNSAMTQPGKIPMEDDLPSLNWSTPKTTRQKGKKLKGPEERTPFFFTEDERTRLPGRTTRRQARKTPPTKQATRRGQPFRLTHHTWESPEEEKENHKTQGERLVEQCSVIQFRRWLKKEEVKFVAAIKLATKEERVRQDKKQATTSSHRPANSYRGKKDLWETASRS